MNVYTTDNDHMGKKICYDAFLWNFGKFSFTKPVHYAKRVY